MDGERQRSGWGRGRRRKPRATENGPRPEPLLIVARRPDSPVAKLPPRTIAASAVPRRPRELTEVIEAAASPTPEPARRAARIVKPSGGETDDRERERQKLLARLMQSQGRGAISRAADEFLRAGFELPSEQEVQLQLLEHFDETRAMENLVVLARLLEADPPVKKPVLEQRLRRLEEHADEPATRELAARLRRTIRS